MNGSPQHRSPPAPAPGDGRRGDAVLLTLCGLLLVSSLFALAMEKTSYGGAEREPLRARAAVTRLLPRVRRRSARSLVWEDLPEGAPVYAEESLFVSRLGALQLRLDEGTVLDVQSDTLIVLGSNDKERGGALELLRGSLRTRTGASALDVEVGRGTQVRLEPGTDALLLGRPAENGGLEQPPLQVEIHEGGATTRHRGRQLRAEAGSSLVLRPGEAPSRRQHILTLHLPARGDLFWRTGEEQSELRFAWSPALPSGRLQLSASLGFADAEEHEVNETELTLPLPSEGLWWWRICDEAGACSETRHFEVRVALPPQLIFPIGDELIVRPQGIGLVLVWRSQPDALKHALELRRRDIEAPTLLYPVDGSSFRVPAALPEGDYSWRVRRSTPPKSPWSTSEKLRLRHRPPLAAPRALEAELGFEPPDETPPSSPDGGGR